MLFRLLAASIFISFALAASPTKKCDCCSVESSPGIPVGGHWHTNNRGHGYCHASTTNGHDDLGCRNICT
ncbi:hypothetical protein M3J09_006859 [Ascochyta lentis]